MEKQENLPPMEIDHAHIELAMAQREQGTLLCPGPCPHMFDSFEENVRVYGAVSSGEVYEYYKILMGLTRMDKTNQALYAALLAGAETYTKRMLEIWVEVCGLRTFKDQDGIYQEWGPPGDFLMMRIVNFVRDLEKKHDIRIVYQHDCKRGDLSATMSGYYGRFIGDLWNKLGIRFSFLPYDTMNISVYMGKDVAMLEEVKKKNVIPARGLDLMRKKGKGIVVLDKTTNDSSGDYQHLYVPLRGKTLEECVAEDVNSWVQQYGLVKDELSPFGLVVGSTQQAKGAIRQLFPTGTWWVPGFGNQGGKFENIMLELIRTGKWNGQGAIFCSETGMMYVWRERFGGTGKVADVEKCAVVAVNGFKESEYEAFQKPEVRDAGINYPFAAAA